MLKIILIEDELNIRLNTKLLLENSGFKVFTVESGEDGILLIKEIHPDLILCDILLPGISGYEVFNLVSNDPETLTIPFIFLTAKADMTDLRIGMNLGADDYIIKPFKANDLINTIKVRLNRRNRIRIQEAASFTQKPMNEWNKKENDHLMVNVNNKPQLIRIKDIACINAEGEYSKVFLSNGNNFIVCKILKKWESILPEKLFIRTHRSTIVNLDYVERIEKWYKRSYKIHIRNSNDTFMISQRYASRLKERMSF